MLLLPMAFTSNRARLLRRALRILGGLIVLLLIAWGGLAWYVHAHKKELLARATQQLGASMRGTLAASDMEPEFFRSFPGISLSLKNVTLRDSLWQRHHHSLAEIKNLYVRVNPFALLGGRVEVKKLTAAGGSIFLFTDSTGYTNTYLLDRKDTTAQQGSRLPTSFGLDDVHFWFVNERKQKLFHFYVDRLDGRTLPSSPVVKASLNTRILVHELNFNTGKGSFLKDQLLQLKLDVVYHTDRRQLQISNQKIRIGGQPVLLEADFRFSDTPASFAIRLQAKELPYRSALSWLSPNIQGKLNKYDFEKPIALDARVSGTMQYRSIPLVQLDYRVEDNTLMTPLGAVKHFFCTGRFYNQVDIRRDRGDDNSRVAMYHFRGTWNELPFHGDTLAVTDLLRPSLNVHFQTTFSLPLLNPLLGGHVLQFNTGNASADLHYQGAILPQDSSGYAINGFVRLADASLVYLPRNLAFRDAAATLMFQGDNLLLRNAQVRSANSLLKTEADARHFLLWYFRNPGKVAIDWRVQSPEIDLGDFIGLAGKRQSGGKKTARNGAIARITSQLDRVLQEAEFNVDAQVARVRYQSFLARNVTARLQLTQDIINMQQVKLYSCGGALAISGQITQSGAANAFSLDANAQQVDVTRLFRSFDNFGQDAIAAENVSGTMTVNAKLSGQISEAGKILRNSIHGTVDYLLTGGEILHFEPFEKISRFAFKRRNLGQVALKDLRGQLKLEGARITIPPTSIRSSAVNMEVKGVYGLQKGTDIFIEMPLRNPERESAATPIGMLLRRGKGFVLNLRAQDAEGNGVKIGWNPFRSGNRRVEKDQ